MEYQCSMACVKQGNKLESLDPLGLGRNPLLRELYIHQNPGLERPQQLSPLKHLEALQTLQVSPGPVAFLPHWRLHCVHLLPQLLRLDDLDIAAEEQAKTTSPKPPQTLNHHKPKTIN